MNSLAGVIDEITPLTLVVLAAVVALGAIVPVVPTGAAVSAAAVIAVDHHLWELPPVILVGGLGAYVGDLVTYAVLSAAGVPLARRLGWLGDEDEHPDEHPGAGCGDDHGANPGANLGGNHEDEIGARTEPTRLERLREQIEQRELRTLLVSRLVPGGRVPVLLVAALTGYPRHRFASAAILAAMLWSLVYASVGIVGGAFFDDTLTAILVAMAAALTLSVGPGLVRRLRPGRSHSPPAKLGGG